MISTILAQINDFQQIADGFKRKAIVLMLWLDDIRIRQHLRRVERQLRRRDVGYMPAELRVTRKINLDRLRNYWMQGQFPRNRGQPRPPHRWAPCFIDDEERVCAVARLVIASGHGDAAERIANTANNAYVEEMALPELAAWTAASGLNKDELALIQPVYYCPDSCIETVNIVVASQVASNLWWIAMGGVAGILASVLNVVSTYHKRWRLLLYGSIVGAAVGVGLIYLAMVNLRFWLDFMFAGFPCAEAPFGSCSMMSSKNLNSGAALVLINQQIRQSFMLGVLFVLVSLGGLLVSVLRIRRAKRQGADTNESAQLNETERA